MNQRAESILCKCKRLICPQMNLQQKSASCQSAWLLHTVSSYGQGPSLTLPFILSLIHLVAVGGSRIRQPIYSPGICDIPALLLQALGIACSIPVPSVCVLISQCDTKRESEMVGQEAGMRTLCALAHVLPAFD